MGQVLVPPVLNRCLVSLEQLFIHHGFILACLALAGGCLLYFVSTLELSSPILVAGLVAVNLLLYICFSSQTILRFTLTGLFLLVLGWHWASWRSELMRAPVLERALTSVQITGTLLEKQPRGSRWRLLIQPSIIAGYDQPLPEILRISVGSSGQNFTSGQVLKFKATLSPPRPADFAGGYDFQRRAYFERLGATGYLRGKIEKIDSNDYATWAGWRLARAEALRQSLPGQAGALAAALMIGERGWIDRQVAEDLRQAGLAHLLAISGLHLGLVAGALFWSARAVVAAFPSIAQRRDVKKWAAVIACMGAAFYLAAAGATIPTQRAFVVTALVLLAILLDRQAISLRLVAAAVVAVLVLEPWAILSASFQLSFSAVAGLVLFYERYLKARFIDVTERPGLLRKLALYLMSVVLSSAIALVATAPFALFHFGRIAPYGVVSNLLAIPLMAFWIMPLALVSFLLMPFGLERLPLTLMAPALEVLMALAREVASWPSASLHLPKPEAWQMGLVLLSMLALLMTRHRAFLVGIGVYTLFSSLSLFYTSPRILVSSSGREVAVVKQDKLVMLKGRPASFVTQQWREAWALSQREMQGGPVHTFCNQKNCSVVIWSDQSIGQADLCRKSQVIVASQNWVSPCRRSGVARQVVITKALLKKLGGLVAYEENGELQWQSAVFELDDQDKPWRRSISDASEEDLLKLQP